MADSVENPPVFKALFMGHSFVQQLAEKAYEIGQPGLKCEKEFTVLYHSIDDLTVKKTYDHLFLLEMIKPHVVILEIGTHDLAKEETDPVELVADIKTLAVHIMEKYKVLRIVISEMYYRKYSPSYPIRDDFIGRIFDFNGALRKMAAASENRNNLHTIITHKHRGMFANWDMYLMDDGYHLTSEAAFKYFKSMRGTLFRTRTPLEMDVGYKSPISNKDTKCDSANENKDTKCDSANENKDTKCDSANENKQMPSAS